MADEGSDLVSNVEITGIDTSTEQLDKFGDKGAAAFDKVGTAAEASAAKVAASSKAIGDGVQAVADVAPDSKTADRLQDIVNGVINLKNAATSSVSSLIGLAAKIEAIGAASILGVGLIARFASSATKSFRELGTATNASTRDTQAQGQAHVVAIRQANQYDKSISDLQDQLRKGKLTYGDYGNAVTKLNNEFNRAANDQSRVAAAQLEAQRRNDAVRLAQQQAVAYKKLTDVYGGPLTDSLIKLGTTYDEVRRQATEAFSPVLAKLIDAVGNVIDKNRAGITAFIDDGAKALDNFIKANGPQIESFFKFMIDLARGLGEVIIAFILPKLERMQQLAGFLADLFNKAFGTNLTAGTLVAAAAVIYLTGTIGTLIKVVTLAVRGIALLSLLFGPWGILIAVVVVAIIALGIALSKIDWEKVGKDASAVVGKIVQFFSTLPERILAFFSQLWDSAKQLASDASTAIIGFFQTVVQWFASFPANLVAIFQALWEQVKSLASAAAQGVIDAWNSTIEFFKRIPSDVGQLFTDLWDNVKELTAAIVQFVIDTWNGGIEFFRNLPATVTQFFTDLWEAVKTNTQQAFDAISGIVKGWVQNVLDYIKPILDAITAVKDFFSSGVNSAEGGAQAFAGGGEVRGPGTSISDSIAAWLSNNEFVMRAKAVAKYGLGFMHAVNNGTLDLGRMLGFAAGGLVQSLQGNQAPRLAFAGGGQATTHASRVLNLSIGGEHFNGLLMPEDVAGRLTKFAVGKQTNSAGRKPAWVGGRK